MVRVDLKALKAGIHEFDWTLTADNLGVDPELFGEIELLVRVDFHPSRVFIKINVGSVAQLTCDRTLVNFEQPVQGEYSISSPVSSK